LDEQGNIHGTTYPKRAKGLIKKGRAEARDEQTIVLYGCRPPDTEDFMQSIIDINDDSVVTESGAEEAAQNEKPQNTEKPVQTEPAQAVSPKIPKGINIKERLERGRGEILDFNPRDWKQNPECNKSKLSRVFITDIFDNVSEIWQLGDWSYNWTEIQTPAISLPQGTDYRFVFWLNGGENDQFNAVCQFEILPDNSDKDKLVYKLNYNAVRPLVQHKGWNLFCIPFNTGDAETIRFKFTAMSAPMAVMSADIDLLTDVIPDKPLDKRVPQRHNIFFPDGFPTEKCGWIQYLPPEYHRGNNQNNNQYQGFPPLPNQGSMNFNKSGNGMNFNMNFGLDPEEFGDFEDFQTVSQIIAMADNLPEQLRDAIVYAIEENRDFF
jgi:hypothetical protein